MYVCMMHIRLMHVRLMQVRLMHKVCVMYLCMYVCKIVCNLMQPKLLNRFQQLWCPWFCLDVESVLGYMTSNWIGLKQLDMVYAKHRYMKL